MKRGYKTYSLSSSLSWFNLPYKNDVTPGLRNLMVFSTPKRTSLAHYFTSLDKKLSAYDPRALCSHELSRYFRSFDSRFNPGISVPVAPHCSNRASLYQIQCIIGERVTVKNEEMDVNVASQVGFGARRGIDKGFKSR